MEITINEIETQNYNDVLWKMGSSHVHVWVIWIKRVKSKTNKQKNICSAEEHCFETTTKTWPQVLFLPIN